MILKVYRIASCKYVGNKCDYKICQEIDSTVKITNKIKPNHDTFIPHLDEKNILEELQDKLEYYGETPDENAVCNFYDYAYEKLIKDNVSKYAPEIETLQKQTYENTSSFTIGLPNESGQYNRDQYMSSWYFEMSKTNTIYLVHNFNWDEGCGCFNSSYPIAIFDDLKEAGNFLKKCNDVAKRISGVYYYLDEYIVDENAFVFYSEHKLDD